jgi:hypothetical protein
VTLDDFAELISTMPADLRILPELGIQTSTFFEIFVTAYGHPTVSITSATLPLSVAIQHQSELFQQCLDRGAAGDHPGLQSRPRELEQAPRRWDPQAQLHVTSRYSDCCAVTLDDVAGCVSHRKIAHRLRYRTNALAWQPRDHVRALTCTMRAAAMAPHDASPGRARRELWPSSG